MRLACLAEVLSPKPGNVSPGNEFDDSTVTDFLKSAEIASRVLAKAEQNGVGLTILNAVKATQQEIRHNTNLGIVLLLTPLCAVPRKDKLSQGIHAVIDNLTLNDAKHTYEAIRLASPGGLGDSASEDVREEPNADLKACMSLAADRDMIARQYANCFADILGNGLDWLLHAQQAISGTKHQIQWLAVRLISEFGDSLIARKCGDAASTEVRHRAISLLRSGWPENSQVSDHYTAFDEYLRSDGHRLNPGTTADMVAAILFSGLRENLYSLDAEIQQMIESVSPESS